VERVAPWGSSGTVWFVKNTRKKENAQPAQQQVSASSVSAAEAGTLRSGLDEPEYLPEAFEQLSADFGVLLGKWDLGRLSAEAFAEALAQLVVREEDGTEWTIGARSGQWYRKGYDGAWHPTTPPEDIGVTRYAYTPPQSAARVLMHDVQVLDPIAHVTDVGVPLEVREPHPVVGTTSSNAELPQFRDAGSMFDEHGGWETSFSAVEDQTPVQTWGLDDLISDSTELQQPAGQSEAPLTDESPTRVWSLRDELEGMGSDTNPAPPSATAGDVRTEEDPNEGTGDDPDDLGLPPELFS
jgi:hypothetical protein